MRTLAVAHKAKMSVIKGDDLLKQNFPMIHAVGRASAERAAADRHGLGAEGRAEGDAGRQGRLLRYRRPRHQAVRGMLLMKKDMGGAANVLGLASMIMAPG